MSSTLENAVALDTNVLMFGLNEHPKYPACRIVLTSVLQKLHVHVPFQVFRELRRHLRPNEIRALTDLLSRAGSLTWDYRPPSTSRVAHWSSFGLNQGDAAIAALLERDQIGLLISENRHFLAKTGGLPFRDWNSWRLLEELNTARDTAI